MSGPITFAKRWQFGISVKAFQSRWHTLVCNDTFVHSAFRPPQMLTSLERKGVIA
jgi:hypothetical protein